MRHDPLIIIGAGRSGTNALRDALTSLEEFSTWPCDEINYIWRTDNRDHPTDQLTPADATDAARLKIQRAFERQATKAPSATLVEKTCANSLRVGFVHSIFPSARFVHIVRDGRDVVASASDRWTAPLDLAYLARKVRYVPLSDLPHYGLRYAKSRLARSDNDDGRLSTWGPRFQGMDELASSGITLSELCAHQWVACVREATNQLAVLPAAQVLTISYEDFVARPAETLADVVGFAGRQASETALLDATSGIHPRSIGKWESALDAEALASITPILAQWQPAEVSHES